MPFRFRHEDSVSIFLLQIHLFYIQREESLLYLILTPHKWDDMTKYTGKHISERLPDNFFTVGLCCILTLVKEPQIQQTERKHFSYQVCEQCFWSPSL